MKNKIKEFIDENSIVFSDEIEFDEIENIKLDYELLSKFYNQIFNEVYDKLKYMKDYEFKTLLRKNKIHHLEIIKLRTYKQRASNFGKSFAFDKLIRYINDNYFEIIEFLDLFREVLNETD